MLVEQRIRCPDWHTFQYITPIVDWTAGLTISCLRRASGPQLVLCTRQIGWPMIVAVIDELASCISSIWFSSLIQITSENLLLLILSQLDKVGSSSPLNGTASYYFSDWYWTGWLKNSLHLHWDGQPHRFCLLALMVFSTPIGVVAWYQ